MTRTDTARSKSVFMAAISAIVAGVVSSAHHVYGAVVYETPWRLVVSLWIPAFVLLLVAMLYLHWKYSDRVVGSIAGWVVLLAGGIFQFGFTFFECIYSHVLKNILFFSGASQAMLLRLFPPPAYHLPDNPFFELTGILQITGLWAAWMSWRVFRTWRRAAS